MGGGIEGMLANLSPTMRWKPPVLHVKYPMSDQDLHLDGRGLRLIPSYFTWNAPVSLADPRLPPILRYPLHHPPADETRRARTDFAGKPLTALLGPRPGPSPSSPQPTAPPTRRSPARQASPLPQPADTPPCYATRV